MATFHGTPQEIEELEHLHQASMGDPRRCPIHGTVISSPDGLFDAPCGMCEGEMEAEWYNTFDADAHAAELDQAGSAIAAGQDLEAEERYSALGEILF